MMQNPKTFLCGKRVNRFEALQHVLVPRSQNFSAGQKKESIRLINHFLSDKPRVVHRKLDLFMRLIDGVSFIRGGRRFNNLPEKTKTRVLDFFFDSPIPLLRKGFWGLNTLAKLGVYGQPSVYEEIGYKKKPLGDRDITGANTHVRPDCRGAVSAPGRGHLAPTRNYDIIVIGSGAGGGTVARELAPLCKQGAKIALLEWGGRFQQTDNTREEIPMAEKYYFDHGGFQTRQQDLTLAFCKAVGGTTTVYTGTSLTVPPQVLKRWNVPGITSEDLQPRFQKFIRENGVHLYPPEEINENNHLFVRGCKKLGWRVEQFPVNTHHCHGLGTCNLGCAVGAKQGTALVQIPEAEKNGVEVISFCRVDRITDHEIFAEVLSPEHGLAPSVLPIGPYRFRAKKIVVSAGAINSPALLLRSFGHQISPALGRYFTCQPALILVGEHPHPITNTFGHPKSFYCDEFAESDHFLLETCMYFPFTLAKNLMGFGTEVDNLIARYPCLQMILVLAIDEAKPGNRITIDRHGNPQVDYFFSERTIRSFVSAIRASTRSFFAAGAKRVHAPAMNRFLIHENEQDKIDELIRQKYFKPGKVSISAAHLMGGCRMGTDPKSSVTDAWGRVHGHPDLYVADASLFPAAVEINPYLTIMALADRVAEAVKNDLGR